MTRSNQVKIGHIFAEQLIIVCHYVLNDCLRRQNVVYELKKVLHIFRNTHRLYVIWNTFIENCQELYMGNQFFDFLYNCCFICMLGIWIPYLNKIFPFANFLQFGSFTGGSVLSAKSLRMSFFIVVAYVAYDMHENQFSTFAIDRIFGQTPARYSFTSYLQ